MVASRRGIGEQHEKSFIVPAIGIICGLSYHMVKNWSRDWERYRKNSKIFRWGYIIGIIYFSIA